MDIVVPKRSLLALLNRAAGVAEKKGTMPVLSCALLVAKGGRLTVNATDLYRAVSDSCEAEVKRCGSICIPVGDIAARVKSMPDGPLTLTVNESTLVLKAAGSARRFTLRGLNGDDFPPMPEQTEGVSVLTLPGSALGRLFASTHFSISTDETRAHLNSALVEWEGSVTRIVSTDGHRLTKAEYTVPNSEANTSFLIPLKAVHEIRRMCEDAGDSPVSISRNASTVFFVVGTVTFSAKAVSADFPPYTQVVPRSSSKSVVVPRLAFVEAVKAVSVSSPDRTNGIALHLEDSKLRITSESAETGEASDEIGVSYTGEALTIGCAAKYLTDLLGAMTDEEVSLGFNGELDPILILPEGGSTAWLGVVMPMRI